ncbi:hypothetical protein STEG23_002161, partial [Scotinomys teguina]
RVAVVMVSLHSQRTLTKTGVLRFSQHLLKLWLQDSLRVYDWEPECCFDVVIVNWDKVADLAICNDQLIEIQNTEDYSEIFHPENSLSQTPPQRSKPFPAPPEDDIATAKEASTPSLAMDVQLMVPNPEVLHPRQAELVDEGAMSQIHKGRDTTCVVLNTRHKNLDTGHAMWITGDIETWMNSAAAISNISVVVDLLNIFNQKASL